MSGWVSLTSHSTHYRSFLGYGTDKSNLAYNTQHKKPNDKHKKPPKLNLTKQNHANPGLVVSYNIWQETDLVYSNKKPQLPKPAQTEPQWGTRNNSQTGNGR